MHKLDLIHRDIKLENIFVDEFGTLKFGDFGLTMSMREERGISPVGTVEYMAPEVRKVFENSNGSVHGQGRIPKY